MSGPVPIEWTRVVAAHHYARIDRETMRSGETQQLRDEATVRYARTLDEIMDNLTVLDDQHMLGRITLLLSKKERV
jgi:hypothetical protein